MLHITLLLPESLKADIVPGLTLTKLLRSHSHVVRALNATPLFIDKIPCLAGIMGETSESGHDLRLDGCGVSLLYPVIPELFSGGILR
jgi:hypothetical protein